MLGVRPSPLTISMGYIHEISKPKVSITLFSIKRIGPGGLILRTTFLRQQVSLFTRLLIAVIVFQKASSIGIMSLIKVVNQLIDQMLFGFDPVHIP